MTRVAFYARFSSDLQNERSADDQIAMLRQIAAVRGLTEVGCYADRGISGASMVNRPGIQALMRDARAGAFEMVLAEDLDRISRDQEDTAHVFKRLNHAGIALETVAQGRVSVMHVGLAGTMNQLWLDQLAHKTRRGLEARVRAGFSGGGRCYGYEIVEKGVLRPLEAESTVIRRVFADFAGGASTRTIAHALNAEGVAGPQGGTWGPNSISGDRRAGDGLLCQELYIGVRVFNRRRYRKDPDTGARSSILNPPDKWLRVPAPELRIIDDDLWSAAQSRLAAIGANPKAFARAPKRLLSGLLRCVMCAGSMTLQGGKYACANHRERGTCPNAKIIRAETVEARVLEGVRTRLLAPEVIARAVRVYQQEMDAAVSAAERDRVPIERELDEIGRRISRAADSYERGVFDLDELEARVAPLKSRRAQLRTALESAGKPKAVRLHPRAAEFYRDLTENLAEALNAPDGGEARDLVRSVIDRVDFHARPGLGNFTLEVHGKLAALLGVSERAAAYTSNCEVGLGAGTGFEPVTFRL